MVLANVEAITGSRFADRITGNGADNRLQGGDGNDTIDGHAGNDSIDAGDGDDWIYMAQPNGGSYGNDTIDGGHGWDSLTFDNLLSSGANGLAIGQTVSDALAIFPRIPPRQRKIKGPRKIFPWKART